MAANVITALLEEKQALYLECERLTETLCTAPVEELASITERRGRLLGKADELDSSIGALCAADSAVRDALNHSCPRGSLSAELGALYDASQAVKAVASRILQNESAARARLEFARDRAGEQLRATEAGSSSVAERYLRSVKTGLSAPFSPAVPKNF